MIQQFTIQPGNNFCDQTGDVNLSQFRKLKFKLFLNHSLINDQGSTQANNAAQKLLGFYWYKNVFQNIHWNSYRLCYSNYNPLASKIVFHAYGYNRGSQKDFKTSKSLNTPFKERWQRVFIPDDMEVMVDGEIELLFEFNQIRLIIPGLQIDHLMNFDFTGLIGKDMHQAFFYVELPGHAPMYIRIEQEYLK